MGELSRRERNEAVAFYLGTSLATIAWWIALIAFPVSRQYFLGSEFGNQWLWIILAPDLLSALVMSTLMVWLIVRRSHFASVLAWIHFGAQGYAWAISIGLAVIDPQAYWGVVAMTFSTGIALAFAIRFQRLDILWGAFRFGTAPEDTPKGHWRSAIRQTGAMWAIFLALIPLGFAAMETSLGWEMNWLTGHWRIWVAVAIFVAGGSLGLWAARAMTGLGEGTPLPSACAKKLVIAGPYRFIRNPMATGGIVQGMAVGLAIGSPLIILYGFIGGVWWELLARNLEETYLAGQFGAAYARYTNAVPCWRFRLSGYESEVVE